MIVRESPKSKVQQKPQNWPPKSPHEALLSSPSGRRKYERQRERNAISPSPSKRRPGVRDSIDFGDQEEEDEETLQLKLQAIEARLKLKQLQKARKEEKHAGIGSGSISGMTASRQQIELPRIQSEVQVPVSPTRPRRAMEDPKSPARVLLGIDKGLRAQDVSLKRAASFSTRLQDSTSDVEPSRAGQTRSVTAPRSKTFSERLAEVKSKDKEQEKKRERIERSRSRGFGLRNVEVLNGPPTAKTVSALSSAAGGSGSLRPPARNFDQPQRSFITESSKDTSSRANSSLSARKERSRTPPTSSKASSNLSHHSTASKYTEILERDESKNAPSFESFSGMHLKSREMQHNVITRTLEGKTIVTIPSLLKTVKAPEYDPPDMENDYVVLGVITSKSAPLTPASTVKDKTSGNQEMDAHHTNKFMVIKISDLKWELDLFLFDTGFSRFWKLQVGTLIAVLNPDIMPPRNRDTGKFSLKLTSSDDTILEIGQARDIDFCHAMRKDGKECGQWIDGRKTEFCDFHIELHVEKSKRGRMEVNTMTGFGKGPGGTGKRSMFGSGRFGGPKGDDLKREGKFHDSSLHETMYIAPSVGGAARLLDRDEQSWDQTTRAERHRKQLAEKEKERELAKKLGELGGTAGSEYMKFKGTASQGLPARGDAPSKINLTQVPDVPTTNDFHELLDRKADNVTLGPSKRKRVASGKSTSSAEPIGWGGAFKRGLLLSPTKTNPGSSLRDTAREPSPAKKKARLLLPEKGIREPGRESLGGLDVGLIAAMDEDDDDLEIV